MTTLRCRGVGREAGASAVLRSVGDTSSWVGWCGRPAHLAGLEELIRDHAVLELERLGERAVAAEEAGLAAAEHDDRAVSAVKVDLRHRNASSERALA